MVYKEEYRGRLVFLGDGREYADVVERLRHMIEENMDVLDQLTKRLYAEPHLGYRFKYASLDREHAVFMLRYFARIPEHPVYAGYQIQLIFDVESLELLRLHVSEVPLE